MKSSSMDSSPNPPSSPVFNISASIDRRNRETTLPVENNGKNRFNIYYEEESNERKPRPVQSQFQKSLEEEIKNHVEAIQNTLKQHPSDVELTDIKKKG